METATIDLESLKKQWTPAPVEVLTVQPEALTARFSPCGRFLAAGGYDGRVRRWRVDGEQSVELEPLVGLGGWVQEIAFAPTGDLLVGVDSWGAIVAWRNEDGGLAWRRDEAHRGWIRGLSVAPQGSPEDRLVATGAADGLVRLWRLADGEPQGELAAEDDVHCVEFRPGTDAIELVAGTLHGRVRHWRLPEQTAARDLDASQLYRYDRIQDVGGVRVLRFGPDGATLAAGGTQPKNGGTVQGEPTILLYDFASGELRKTLALGPASECYVHDIWLHESGIIGAVTCGTPGSGKLTLRRADDETPLFASQNLPNCHSLSVHPDGRRLAVTTTNRDSNGNGRRLDKDGNYAGNSTPIHVLRWE